MSLEITSEFSNRNIEKRVTKRNLIVLQVSRFSMSDKDNKLIGKLNKDFSFFLKEIFEYLELPLIRPNFRLIIQEDTDSRVIPSIGKSFGVQFDSETNELILANWLTALPIREQKNLFEYLLIKEAFRFALTCQLDFACPSNDLVELVLFVIAALWLIKYKDITSSNPQIVWIRHRSAFDDDDFFHHVTWDSYVLLGVLNDTQPIRIYDEFVRILTWSHVENKSYAETIDRFTSWINQYLKERDTLLLPIHMPSRDFQVIKIIHQLGQDAASPKTIGDQFELSHDTIDNLFKEFYDKYNTYWYAKHNFLLLNLYPYFFRITLTNKKYSDQLLTKLKETKYMYNIFTNSALDIICGTLYCPLIVHNHLHDYFEKLAKKEIISKYFFQQIRCQQLYSSITTENIEPTVENYKKFLENPSQFSYETLLLDETIYDIVNAPKAKRKIAIDENLLTFFSIFCARYLIKAHYMLFPLSELFELCKRNGINPEESEDLMDFVNKMELRTKRLNLIDYCLFIHPAVYEFRRAVLFELIINPENPLVNQLVNKFKVFSALVVYKFYDRVIFGFIDISLTHSVVPLIEEIIKTSGISPSIYKIQTIKNFQRYIPFHELYDYQNHQWTF